MDEYTILNKYDHLPKPQDTYERARFESAQAACNLLKKVTSLTQKTQSALTLSIISLCRHANLSVRERDVLFGQGVLKQRLFELIMDGYASAMLLAMLDAIDIEEYGSAAKMAADIDTAEWEVLSEGKLDEFLLRKTPDAALVCLLGNQLGNIPYWDFDLKEMLLVVKQHHPHIETFFELL